MTRRWYIAPRESPQREGWEVAGMAPDEITPEEMKFEQCAGALSGRYRALLREIFDRLPSGWDEPRTFSVAIGGGAPGFGCALRFDEGEDTDDPMGEQLWLVTLYPALLDKLSDAAVRWVIGHELAHVASGCVCGIVVDGRAVTRIP